PAPDAGRQSRAVLAVGARAVRSGLVGRGTGALERRFGASGRRLGGASIGGCRRHAGCTRGGLRDEPRRPRRDRVDFRYRRFGEPGERAMSRRLGLALIALFVVGGFAACREYLPENRFLRLRPPQKNGSTSDARHKF